MKSLALAILAIVSSLSLLGCAAQKPLISHAHVGHGLTHWMDTPGNQGLFQVARQELDVALREADAALAGDFAPAQKALHLENVVYALNPAGVPSAAATGSPGSGNRAGHAGHADHASGAALSTGSAVRPGLGYGAIRALESAIEHLEYAATSDDASTNIVSSVAPIAEMGLAIVERLQAVEAQALAARRGDTGAFRVASVEGPAASDVGRGATGRPGVTRAATGGSSSGSAFSSAAADGAALDRAAVELRAKLRAAAQGYDADGNGRIDATAAEAGLVQLHAQLDAMLARESDPKYAPLPKKYLLGVVRLPDGRWIFTTIRKALSRPRYGY
jgi:hypothetical protein